MCHESNDIWSKIKKNGHREAPGGGVTNDREKRGRPRKIALLDQKRVNRSRGVQIQKRWFLGGPNLEATLWEVRPDTPNVLKHGGG